MLLRQITRRFQLCRAVGSQGTFKAAWLQLGQICCEDTQRPSFEGWTGAKRTMKVYTKTGDKGTSQLFNGERRGKDDEVFQALGAIDECNAMIGLAREFIEPLEQEGEELEYVMSRMFDVGASVATPQDSSSQSKIKRAQFDPVHVQRLEKKIDEMDAELPPLKTFVLPSGGKCAAHLHVARTFARKAERHVVPLVRDGHADPQVGIYLNRLSDFLFMLARYVAMKQGFTEKVWVKSKIVENEEESSTSTDSAPQ